MRDLRQQGVTVILTTHYIEEAEDKLREAVGLSRHRAPAGHHGIQQSTVSAG